MFKKFFGTAKSPAPTRSRAERLSDYDLTKRPFTRALLLKVATHSDNAQKSLFGQIDPPHLPLDLNDQISVAVPLATTDILCGAMKEAIGQSIFWPHEPLPKTARLIVMFAFVIMTGFAGPLEEEGYTINFKRAAVGFISSFFQNHSLEEQANILQQASGAFAQMHQANVPKVAEWQEQVRQAAQLYVLQFITQDEELKEKNLQPFFGVLLKRLLALAE